MIILIFWGLEHEINIRRIKSKSALHSMKCKNSWHMLLFIVLLLLVVLFLLIKFKKFLPVEYILWIHSLSNFLCVSWMQHKIHPMAKYYHWLGLWEMCFLLICVASCAVLLYDIYGAPVKHFTMTAFFFHWCYLIIQSLLGENVSWFSALLRTWTKKTV